MSTRRSKKGKPQFLAIPPPQNINGSHLPNLGGSTPSPDDPLPLVFPNAPFSSVTTATTNGATFTAPPIALPSRQNNVTPFPNVTNTDTSASLGSFTSPSLGSFVSREHVIRDEREKLNARALIATLGEAVKLARGARECIETVMAHHRILPSQLPENGLGDEMAMPRAFDLADAYPLFHAHTLLRAAEQLAGDPAVNSVVAMVAAMKETVDAVCESDCLEAIAAWIAMAGDGDTEEARQINRIRAARQAYAEAVEQQQNVAKHISQG